LGISREALRKRINRGSIPAEKRHGRWVVFLDADTLQDAASPHQDEQDAKRDTGQDAFVASLQEDIRFLRAELTRRSEELRREQHLLAAALERLPALAESNGIENASQDANAAPWRADAPHMAPASLNAATDAPASGAAGLAARLWRVIRGHWRRGE